MVLLFVPDQQLVVAAWIAITVVILGFGLLERRIFGPALESAGQLWQVFWVGVALLLCTLQLWHAFAPIDDRTRMAAAAVAAAGWLAAGLAPWRAIFRSLPRSLPGIAASLACALWLSNQCLGGPRFGDTGLYLIPSVHWAESYAVVPGIANLFVPLGYNISYFLFGALIDTGPFSHRIYPIINSSILVVAACRGLFACSRLLRRRAAAHLASDVYHALSLVALAELVFSLYLTSPMPDTVVFVYGIAIGGQLIELLAEREPRRADLVRLAFLGATGLTIKLSLAGLAVATPAVALAWWTWRCGRSIATTMQAATLALLAALPPALTWIYLNTVSSGFPFYPAALLPLGVDWIARVDATAFIQGPMAVAPISMAFRDPAWWHQHLESLGWFQPDALRPLAAVAFGFAVMLVGRSWTWWTGRRPLLPLLLLAAPLLASWFSFTNTPMVRYQGAALWILAIDMIVLALPEPRERASLLLRLLVVATALAGAASPVWRGMPAWLDLKEFESTSPPVVHDETLPSGLVVKVPQNQVCWYAPLPCTPEPNKGLRMRDPGDLGDGFSIDPPAK